MSITSRACPFRYVQRWDSIRWTNVASKHFTDQRLPLKHAIYASRDRKRRSFRDGYLCILAQLNSIKRASSLRLKLGYINFVTNFALWREREFSGRYQKLRISNICFNFIIQTEFFVLEIIFFKRFLWLKHTQHTRYKRTILLHNFLHNTLLLLCKSMLSSSSSICTNIRLTNANNVYFHYLLFNLSS